MVFLSYTPRYLDISNSVTFLISNQQIWLTNYCDGMSPKLGVGAKKGVIQSGSSILDCHYGPLDSLLFTSAAQVSELTNTSDVLLLVPATKLDNYFVVRARFSLFNSVSPQIQSKVALRWTMECVKHRRVESHTASLQVVAPVLLRSGADYGVFIVGVHGGYPVYARGQSSSTHAGAWSLALGRPRTHVSTPASTRRGASCLPSSR